MEVVRDNLPTEGVIIGGVHFKPGKVETVDAELGAALTERKGFTEVSTKATTTKEKRGS